MDPKEPPDQPVGADPLFRELEILEPIGRGAMGVVYRARQRSLDRLVALKILTPQVGEHEAALQRFSREITALAQCDHPNVVRILHSGAQGSSVHYVMEYVEGIDLRRLVPLLELWRSQGALLQAGHLAAVARVPLEEESPPPPELPRDGRFHHRLAELFAGAARGLQHLHDRGILHRDVKPGNLRLTVDGERLKVMDLGLAKLADTTTLTMSNLGILGTLRYAAPEQFWQGPEELDARADVYGLGASLYEAAVGRPMYDGDTENRLIRQILQEPPPKPRKLRPELPVELDTIIGKATAREPEERYGSAGELADDLEAFAQGRPIRATRPGPLRRLRRWGRRRRKLVLGLAAMVLVALGSAGGWWLHIQPVQSWFTSTTTRWNVLQGVGELAPEELSHCCSAYRFTRRRGRVERVELFDSRARLDGCLHPNRIWEHDYDERGLLREMVVRDQRGRVELRLLYADDGRREDHRDPNNNPRLFKDSDASTKLWLFDEGGFRVEVRTVNVFGSPRADEFGAVGWRFERNTNGMEIRKVALPAEDGVGRPLIGSVERRVDPRGHVTGMTILGPEGEPTDAVMGFSSVRYELDRWGNLVGVSQFDRYGEPIQDEDGWYSARFVRDQWGRVVEESFHDGEGKPARSTWGIARRRFDYSGEGRLVRETCLDIQGRPSNHLWGYAIAERRLNELGEPLEEWHYGQNGKLVLDAWGCAGVRYEYQEEGQLVTRRFFGTDLRPIESTEGCLARRERFDERGNLLETTLLGVDGRPVLGSDGWAIQRIRLDERGREVRRSYLDVMEVPVLSTDGYAERRRRYDDWGREVETAYLDTRGEGLLIPDGYASLVRHYDGRGDEVESWYLGLQGEPVTGPEGCAGYRRSFDAGGGLLEELCLGADGTVLEPEPSPEEGAG